MDKDRKNPSEEEIETTGEDNVDEPQIIDEEETQNDKIKKLKAKLKSCEEEKNNHLDELQRAKAEFLNTKRRLEERTIANAEKNLNDFIASILPLCDSFEMAMADKNVWESVDENWRKGIEGIRSQLNSILSNYNVTDFASTGEVFDPNRHEAMSTVDAGEKPETIIEVLQKGYERNNTVLRPAKVIIQN